ncbi:MAG: NYN domain-containing protein [Moorellaceae bacterium]
MGVLIIDGYNVIHSWPELIKLKESNLSHARDKLIEEMVNFRALRGEKVIIVFDAHHFSGSEARREEVAGVEVIYSRQGETADTAIEKLAGELVSQGEQVLVVTADWLEQRLVWGKGALRLSPTGLRRLVYEARKEAESYARNHDYNPLDAYLSPFDREILEKWRRG